MTKTTRFLYLAAGLLVAIQFVPVSRTNPPVESEPATSPDVEAILRRSCYDCHSHETRWPWYSRIAPVSWLVAHDVNEAREELNFSMWNVLPPAEQRHKLKETWEEVEKRHMPLPIYLLLHPDARVSRGGVATLKAWAESTRDTK
jgi:hypothetical protein